MVTGLPHWLQVTGLHGYRVTTLVTGRGGKSYYFPKGLRTKIFTFLNWRTDDCTLPTTAL